MPDSLHQLGVWAQASILAKIAYNFIVISLAYVSAYLGLEIALLPLYASLLIIDYVTGILKASIRGDKFEPKYALHGLFIKLSFLILPLAVAIAGKAMGTDSELLVKLIIKVIIVHELYSILDNVYTMHHRGAKTLPEFDGFQIMAKHLREYFKDKDIR